VVARNPPHVPKALPNTQGVLPTRAQRIDLTPAKPEFPKTVRPYARPERSAEQRIAPPDANAGDAAARGMEADSSSPCVRSRPVGCDKAGFVSILVDANRAPIGQEELHLVSPARRVFDGNGWRCVPGVREREREQETHGCKNSAHGYPQASVNAPGARGSVVFHG